MIMNSIKEPSIIDGNTFSLPKPSSSSSSTSSLSSTTTKPIINFSIPSIKTNLLANGNFNKDVLNTPPNTARADNVPSQYEKSKAAIASLVFDLNPNNSSQQQMDSFQMDVPDYDSMIIPGTDQYYCKYCDKTWPIASFKNKQAFGAHCSNCSRKRKQREDAFPYVPEMNNEKRVRGGSGSGGGSGMGHHNRNEFDGDSMMYGHHMSESPYSPMSPESPRLQQQPPPFMGGVNPNIHHQHSDLLRFGLLDVIEDKIVEENEIEFIKRDLKNIDSDIVIQDMRKEKDITNAKSNMQREIKETGDRLKETIRVKWNADEPAWGKMKEEYLNEFDKLFKTLDEEIEKVRKMGSISVHVSPPPGQQQDGQLTSMAPIKTSTKLESNETINKMISNIKQLLKERSNTLNATLQQHTLDLERQIASDTKECEKSINKRFNDIKFEINSYSDGLSSSFDCLTQIISKLN